MKRWPIPCVKCGEETCAWYVGDDFYLPLAWCEWCAEDIAPEEMPEENP